MLYCTPNEHRVFMWLTLKVYIANYYKIYIISHEKVIWSLVIFRMISKSQKKEEVYNILIINNLYINIYFFASNFWKSDKWQMTFCQ